jgi:hypothetical protein
MRVAPRVASALLAAFVALSAATPARSQSALRSSILGTVRDTSGAVLVDASVIVRGPGLPGGLVTTTTHAAGEYRVTGLVPGEFSVRAEAAGFTPLVRHGLLVPLESTVVVDLVLEVAGPADVVEVSIPAPTVDPTSSAAPTGLSRAQITELPTSRNPADLLNLAPGVSLDVAFGGTRGSNDVRIEGVSLVEPSLGNSWTSVSYGWLDQAQVVALGASAEYNGSTGAITSAVLRSGTNRVRGTFEYHFIDESWTGDNTKAVRAQWGPAVRPKTLDVWRDVTGDVGGPVVRDHLWFFGGVQLGQYDYRGYGFPGPGHTSEDRWRVLAKLDGAPVGRLRMSGFYQREDTSIDGYALGPGGYGPYLEATQTAELPNDLWNARASWQLGASTLLEGRVGGYRGYSDYEPRPPATREGPVPIRDVVLGAFLNTAPIYLVERRRNVEASITLSQAWQARGTHDLKVGLEHANDRAAKEVGTVSGRVLYVRGEEPVQMEAWAGDVVDTSSRRTGVFVQHRWITPWQLTFEPGLRLDANRGSIPVRGQVFSTTPVAPRLGVAWDVRSDHRTVVRTHVGRYHDRVFTNLFAGNDVTHRSDRIAYAPDGSGGWTEIYRYGEGFDVPVGGDLAQPRVDQAVIGVEHEVVRDVAATAQYIHREFGDFIGYWNEAVAFDTFTLQDPGADGRLGTADDGGILTGVRRTNATNSYQLANPERAWRRYDAVQFIVNKRASQGWHLQASWTWSRTQGTIGNQPNTNAAYWDLSPLGNANARARPPGRVAFDFNEAKVLGAWRVPWLWGGVIGGVWRWQTGIRWARVVNSGAPYNVSVPAEPPGAREGPAIASLDLRFEKTFPLGWRGATLGLLVDVFNATNEGAPLSINGTSGQFFGRPSNYTDPRMARVGVRTVF